MRKLIGEVRRISNGKILVPVEQLPGLKKQVCNEKGKNVGVTADYIGQTKTPYVVILATEEVKIGDKIFLM